jgi:nitrate reductase delta subunit
MIYPNVEHRRLLRLFAGVLDYPTVELAEKVRQCEALVASLVPEAVPLVRAFRTFAERTPLGLLEEIYTGIFDLNPMCCPYVGYHLFGDHYQRSAFLVALQERYRVQGFAVSQAEVADRLSVVLRFVAESKNEDESRELIDEGLLPALERMTKRAEAGKEDPAEWHGRPGPSTPHLEGHSEGEILGAGFLLEITEGACTSSQTWYAYQCALDAVQLVLKALEPPHAAEQITGSLGGRDDD